jgi:hypothetical protein
MFHWTVKEVIGKLRLYSSMQRRQIGSEISLHRFLKLQYLTPVVKIVIRDLFCPVVLQRPMVLFTNDTTGWIQRIE